MVNENSLIKIKNSYNLFSKTEKKIANYLLKHTEKFIYMTILELAKSCKVSKASVIRFYTKLGYQGYQEFKVSITMDTAKNLAIYEKNENKEDLDHLLEEVTRENITTLTDSLNTINRKNVESAAEILLNSDNIEVFGMGPSWITAEAIKCKFLKLNLKCNATQDLYVQCIATANLKKCSTALVITFSGQTPLFEALSAAKKNGTKIISICNYENTQISSIADVILLTSTTESPLNDGELTTIMGQLNIVDMLYTLMALKAGAKHKEHLKKINKATFCLYDI